MTDELRPTMPRGMEEDLTSDDDVRAEVLVAEIEQTRGQMTETVAAIGERLDPATIADQARETVRDATVGRVERQVRTMQDAANDFMRDPARTAQETGTGILETIRRNPMPAALAGIGIGWLLMSRDQRSDGRGASPRTWEGTGSEPRYVGARGGGPTDRPAGTADELRRRADDLGRRADDLGRRAGHAADELGRTVERVPDQLSGGARQMGDVVSDNPLAVGALALAVGTAVGLAMPATRTERRILGGVGEGVMERAEETVSDTLHKAERSLADAEQRAPDRTEAPTGPTGP